MAGLLRVTILNLLPATRRKLHACVAATPANIDTMLDSLVADGKVVASVTGSGHTLYERSPR